MCKNDVITLDFNLIILLTDKIPSKRYHNL